MDRNDDLIYFKSNKGNEKLLHEGFVCQINRVMGETCYWLCEQRLEKSCGRLIVKNGIITKRRDHNHAPDRLSAEVQRSLADMKESIRDVRESTSAVINRHVEKWIDNLDLISHLMEHLGGDYRGTGGRTNKLCH